MSKIMMLIAVAIIVMGGILILDAMFSPFHGAFVDVDFAFRELILGAGLIVLGGIVELIGKSRRPRS